METNMENQIRTGCTLLIPGTFPRIRVQGFVGWGRIRVQGFRVQGFEGLGCQVRGFWGIGC